MRTLSAINVNFLKPAVTAGLLSVVEGPPPPMPDCILRQDLQSSITLTELGPRGQKPVWLKASPKDLTYTYLPGLDQPASGSPLVAAIHPLCGLALTNPSRAQVPSDPPVHKDNGCKSDHLQILQVSARNPPAAPSATACWSTYCTGCTYRIEKRQEESTALTLRIVPSNS
jgi:hypothetical protein